MIEQEPNKRLGRILESAEAGHPSGGLYHPAGESAMKGASFEKGGLQVVKAGSRLWCVLRSKRPPLPFAGGLRRRGRSSFMPLAACIVTCKLDRFSFVCFPIPGKVEILSGLC